MANNPILRNDPLGDTTSPDNKVKFTLAITLGLSLKGDFKIDGTPIKGGVEINTNEIDLLGVRDGELKAGGYNFSKGTQDHRKSIGANILGFGGSREDAYSTKEGKTEVKSTTETNAFFATIESAKSEKTGKTEKTTYLVYDVKAALFIGIEFSIKIPIDGKTILYCRCKIKIVRLKITRPSNHL